MLGNTKKYWGLLFCLFCSIKPPWEILVVSFVRHRRHGEQLPVAVHSSMEKHSFVHCAV